MAKIVLCRVDSRLVHGQVMTKWVQQSGANEIVIVSDTVSKDQFLLDIYKMSAPPGMDIRCYDREKTVSLWQEGQLLKGNTLLLFADIATLYDVCSKGVEIKEAQIGGLGGGPSRKVVYKNITLDEKDASALEELSNKGMNIIFQTIPEDRALPLEEALEKFRK